MHGISNYFANIWCVTLWPRSRTVQSHLGLNFTVQIDNHDLFCILYLGRFKVTQGQRSCCHYRDHSYLSLLESNVIPLTFLIFDIKSVFHIGLTAIKNNTRLLKLTNRSYKHWNGTRKSYTNIIQTLKLKKNHHNNADNNFTSVFGRQLFRISTEATMWSHLLGIYLYSQFSENQ